MPFKSQDELDAMRKSNPRMAQMYVNRAKREGKPVVSPMNPGYSKSKEPESPDSDYRDRAINRRLGKAVQDRKKDLPERLNEAVRKRIKTKYPPKTDKDIAQKTSGSITTPKQNGYR